jgi:DNA polymerase-4
LIEPLSIDEAFIDATGNERLFGPPERLARLIKHRIKSELHLTASIGVAPNKFLAKLASDLKKPDGLVVITPADIDTILPPLPVTKIWGVGPATAARLAEVGVRTIGDLRALSPDRLRQKFGAEGEHFLRLAHGIDDRPVVSDRGVKSIGSEQTFGVDVENPEEVRRVLLDQVEQVARRLRKSKMLARCVSLKIRYGDFETISRSMTLDSVTDSTSDLWNAADAIFDRWVNESFQPVRLIGMTAEQLSVAAGQLGLFDQVSRDKQRRVDEATDRIVDKFGKGAIKRGG